MTTSRDENLPFDDGDVATQPAAGDQPAEGWPAAGAPGTRSGDAVDDGGRIDPGDSGPGSDTGDHEDIELAGGEVVPAASAEASDAANPSQPEGE